MLYPGQNAVNRTLWWTDGVMKFIGISSEPRRIVAVVPDFDDENIIPSPAMTIYQPIRQEGWQRHAVCARTSGSLRTGARPSPALIHEMSADQPVEQAARWAMFAQKC